MARDHDIFLQTGTRIEFEEHHSGPNALKKGKRTKAAAPKRPDREATLELVRAFLVDLRALKFDGHLTVEGIAERLRLERQLVQQVMGPLRTEGFLSPPINHAPGGTWRGGGYDDYSGWTPTRWKIRCE